MKSVESEEISTENFIYYGGLEYEGNKYLDRDLYDDKKYNLIGFKNYEKKISYVGGQSNGLKSGKGKEYYFDGKLKFEGEYLNGKKWNGIGYDINQNIIYYISNGCGTIKEYYSDGRLKFEGEYLYGELNGKVKKFNIEYKVFDFWACEQIENREFYYLEFEGEYKNGKKNGKGKEYNMHNKLKFEGEYLNGEKHGKGKEYNDDGKLIFEGEYLNGVKNGKGKEYNVKNGKLIFEGEYLGGKKVDGKVFEYYYFYNTLKFEGKYLNGRKWEGIEYDFNHNIIYRLKEGELYSKDNKKYNDILIINEEIINGNNNGKAKEYYKDGRLQFEGEYKNGTRFKGKEYYNNGKLSFEGQFYNNKPLNGKKIDFGPTNKIKFEGNYIYGKKNGYGKEYNERGLLIFEGEYSNGE